MNYNQNQNLLTPEGLKRLTDELHHMKTERREKLAERLHRAFEDGQDDDFVDNAELEAARHEQSFLEGRILELEAILNNYELIESREPGNRVAVGDHVTIMEEGTNEPERYHLVGAAEANPDEGRISNVSPLGRVLVGAKIGDKVTVEAPNGLKLNFRVKKIE